MFDPSSDVSRRGFLRTAAGATTATAATGAAAAQEDGTPTGAADGTDGGSQNGTEGGGQGTAAGTPAGGQTHTVDMTDQLTYDPDSITIAPGDAIEWVNAGDVGHTVTAYGDEIPEGAEYFASGGFDSQDAAVSNYVSGDPDAGFIPGGGTYEHAFQATGDYEYYCIPHEGAGMVATVTVAEGGGQPTPAEGEGGPVSQVPGYATNFVMVLTAGLLGVLSFVYVVIKYGGDYSIEE